MKLFLSFAIVLFANAAFAEGAKPIKKQEPNPTMAQTEHDLPTPVYQGANKLAAGYLESIYLPAIKSKLEAKLDTGADTASIDAEIIEVKGNVKKILENGNIDNIENGRVIFAVEDKDGNKKVLERKIRRWIQIKSKDGTTIRRPVVFMEVCLAGRLVKDEMNLAERTNFNFPVLIGRNMLSEAGIMVDPSIEFVTKPDCELPKEIEPKTEKKR
jgi:hypothetical protein